jgi:hypothetical protein
MNLLYYLMNLLLRCNVIFHVIIMIIDMIIQTVIVLMIYSGFIMILIEINVVIFVSKVMKNL